MTGGQTRCNARKIKQLRRQYAAVGGGFARRCRAAQSAAGIRYSTGVTMLVRLPAAGLLAVFMLAGCGRADAAPQGAPASAAAGISWTKFTDPAEKAFAVEVPQGWSIRGGMFRMGFSDARPMVDMTSPDGRINVRLGDVSVPSYVLPGPYHERAGEIYDFGAQAQMVVARYHSGPEFATLYSHARFHELCRNPQGDPNPSGLALPDFVPSPL